MSEEIKTRYFDLRGPVFSRQETATGIEKISRAEILNQSLLLMGSVATTLGASEVALVKWKLKNLEPGIRLPRRGNLSVSFESVHSQLEKYYSNAYGYMTLTQPEVTGHTMATIRLINECLRLVLWGSNLTLSPTLHDYLRSECRWFEKVCRNQPRDLDHIQLEESQWIREISKDLQTWQQQLQQRRDSQNHKFVLWRVFRKTN